MSDPFHHEPVAAARSGEVEHSTWLLELGAAARARPPRRGVRAWGSRRAAARARRQFVEHLFAASAAPPVEEMPQVEEPAAVERVERFEPPRVAFVPVGPVVEAIPLEAIPVEVVDVESVEHAGEPAAAAEPAEEIVPPLLSRIAAYTAKPSGLSVH